MRLPDSGLVPADRSTAAAHADGVALFQKGLELTDLVASSYFGIPCTLATVESPGGVMFALVPSSTLWDRGRPLPMPLPRWRSLPRARSVQ